MCLSDLNLSQINPVTDAAATSRGLKEAAAICRPDQAALAARLLIAAAVIDGLLARVLAEPDLLAAAPDLLEWAEKCLAAYMPQFNDSRAVDDCLVGLAAAVAKATA